MVAPRSRVRSQSTAKLAACLVVAAAATAPTTGFVTRNGSVLLLDGLPYRAAGANAYWLGLDENGGVRYPSRFRTTDALETLAGWLGPGALVRGTTLGVSTGGPLSFEPALGVFNGSALLAADFAIAEAERLGLRLIVPLTDNGAHYAGGKRDFVRWLGLPEDDDGAAFYSDARAVAAFEDYVRARLEHVNAFTGRRAADEPAIAMWETGNELMAPANWTASLARFIKRVAPRHLVLDGSYWAQQSAAERAAHLAIAEVDAVTDHFYPPDAARLAATLGETAAVQKAFTLGEFGWADGAKLDAMLDVCAAAQACATAAPWSFFPHADDHGFVEHGDGFTFHFPGWNSSAALHLVGAVRNFSWFVRQPHPQPQPEPYVGPSTAPAVTTAAPGLVGWRGAAMSGAYDVQVAPAPGGPWRYASNNSSSGRPRDSDTPWRVPGGAAVVGAGSWVRVRGLGFDDGAAAGPWSKAVQVVQQGK